MGGKGRAPRRAPVEVPERSLERAPAAFAELDVCCFRVGSDEFAILSVGPVRAGEDRADLRAAPCPDPDALTSSERAILVMALQGLSNAAIAQRRGASVRTVANQMTALFRKLGVRSRRELAARCASRSVLAWT